MTQVAALQVDAVTVHYGPVLALRDVALTLQPGRVCGLVGMNGSGKSTLFKTIMGLVRPDTGAVRIHGTTPTAARKAGLVGYMPQSEAIDWAFPLSVRDVVLTGRYGHMGPTRRARVADQAAVDDALERVELTDYQHRQIGALSGGQRKRAFLARCIAQGADLLLLDEPFAGVDKRSEATISALLRELAAGGATILVSTHDLHALPELADEAILLMRTVLAHDQPDIVLQPHNLARAFGLDVLNDTPGPR
ncbi:metal ABC transporter ATP-binding protein [Mycolicibacterium fortuitum]|uniref:Metal ABC transporter ATP-binding protein n=2 Tax=Mycolicibacterium fortuitum TaxID=1766 RepID=A0AAE4VIW3_MYCFO|nr:metal ABC transporter ATP-binding protein [Mycolicibacterium fortuitum]MCV7142365.1 metal ABC transporter ATP-binding protein [Mycolicibacterium fortuitum]MDV7195638.1 metal ABC transporter ATP-binding protein [Mycolicibacterium fortuitum]MDV7209414.1 metal ABC transporter ATP-binding protein [Mycolicibacterium fortuitum]MDV7231151.1 metal ABC transporter ATP-binding protein [Mycolicibacterium fortuitum]MDV7262736.1 metal ABC transporter ATP-binding protein [Mycolicibacterium fortuitum]